MNNKKNIVVPPHHLNVLNIPVIHDDHVNSEEKDCCGSCQGNGVCLKVGLMNDIKVIELEND